MAPVDPDALDPHASVLVVASLVGLVGLYLKLPVASWITLFLSLSYFSTARRDTMDLKQFVVVLMFGVMGVLSNIFFPRRPGADTVLASIFGARPSS